jgi:hypothetical protein
VNDAGKVVKGPRLLNRPRRSRDEIQNLLEWVQYILSEDEGQITVRHLFYRLVGHGVIEKSEHEYKALGKHLSKWRRAGLVKWSAFADSTRWHIKSPTFDSLEEAFDNNVSAYRRNLWSTQKTYLEIWCEKDAVAGILADVAEPFRVPVFVARGFASLSSLYGAANTFRGWAEVGKICRIYHFGDFDPSGVEAGESMTRALRDDFKVEVEFVRAAVTPEQIRKLKLQTRPTKESNHDRGWTGGESVELDSMPPAEIRLLVERCITQHIDQWKWEMAKATEAAERDTYQSVKKYLPKNGPS